MGREKLFTLQNKSLQGTLKPFLDLGHDNYKLVLGSLYSAPLLWRKKMYTGELSSEKARRKVDVTGSCWKDVACDGEKGGKGTNARGKNEKLLGK